MKGLMKFIGMLAWFFAAVGAIHHWLVEVYGFSLMKLSFIPSWLPMYVYWTFGISGIITLLWFFKELMNSGCHCNCKEHMK